MWAISHRKEIKLEEYEGVCIIDKRISVISRNQYFVSFREYFSKHCPFHLDFWTLMQFIRKKRKLIGFDDYSYSWPIMDRNIKLWKHHWGKSLSAGKGDKLLNFVDLQTRVFRNMPYLSLSGEIWHSGFLWGRKDNG